MDIKKAIEKRKSIRKYLDKPISDKVIIDLIDSARLAPSGGNTQPSRYFIISDKEIKEKLKKNKVFVQDWVYSSPVLILCLANPKVYRRKSLKGFYSRKSIALCDLSIASSYIVLRATELGLGTCYVGWRNEKKLKKILSIPKHYLLPYVITLGYPAEKPKARPRKKVEEVIIGKI